VGGGGKAGKKIESVLLLAKNIFFRLGLELMNYGMKSDLETPGAFK
jgi:hypothetical protein